MGDFPRSSREFEARFPDDEACARWLLAKRWPEGFRCPACGHDHGWKLGRGVVLIECAQCHRQTSVTAGPPAAQDLVLAAWLVATHRNGISARQLWLQLGFGLLQDGLAAAREAAPRDGRPRTRAARRPGRGRRDQHPPAHQGRPDHGQARPLERGQAPDRRRGRDRRPGSGPGATGGDRGPFGADPRRFRRWPRPSRQHGGQRRLVGLREVERGQARSQGGRADGGACASCPGSTASSPTPSAGPSASTTACGRRISNAISTSSCSASIAGERPEAAFASLLGLVVTHDHASYQMLISQT